MKYVYIGFNALLIIMISVFVFVYPNEKVIALKNNTKSITSDNFKKVQLRKVETEVKKEEKEVPKEEVVQEEKKEIVSAPVASVVETPTVETQVGALAAYGPDCSGCSIRTPPKAHPARARSWHSCPQSRGRPADRLYPCSLRQNPWRAN